MKPIRVAIIDDDQQFLRQFSEYVRRSERFSLVGTFDRGRPAAEQLAGVVVDVVVLDINMPGWDGIRTAKVLLVEYPGVKILFTTVRSDDEYMQFALDHGCGYIFKVGGARELLSAIESTYYGRSVLAEKVAARLRRDELPTIAELGLTEAQLEVLKDLCRGLSNEEIAGRRESTVSTVKKHVSQIIAKLGVDNRIQVLVALSGFREGREFLLPTG